MSEEEFQEHHYKCRDDSMKMFNNKAPQNRLLRLEYETRLAKKIEHPLLNILLRAVEHFRFLTRPLKRHSSHLRGDTTVCDGSPILMHHENALQPDKGTINMPPALRPLHQCSDESTPCMNGMVGGEDDDRMIIKRDVLVKRETVTILYSCNGQSHEAFLEKFIDDGFKRVTSLESQRIEVGIERKYSCVLSSEGSSINVFPKEGHMLDVRGLLDGAVKRHTFVVMRHCGDPDTALLNFKISTEPEDETCHLFPFTIEMIQKGHQMFAKEGNGKQSSSAEDTAFETSARERIASVAPTAATDIDNEDDGANNTDNVQPFKKMQLMTELLGCADGLDLQVYHDLFKRQDITFDMLVNMGHDFLEKI